MRLKMKLCTPYNFLKSIRIVRSFNRISDKYEILKFGYRIKGKPVVVSVSPIANNTAEVKVRTQGASNDESNTVVRWVLFDELCLTPFYNLVKSHSVLGPIVKELWGTKPMRPASLLEMAVSVITEQQISLIAAKRLQTRLAEKLGDCVDDTWVFPDADTLAGVPLNVFRSCGFSLRKAEYIHDFASRIVSGSLDLEKLKTMPEADIYNELTAIRGWGSWSANYFLVRGLARRDCVPEADIAIRSVVGEYLGNGQRVSQEKVIKLLEPFRPYMGLICFYLLAYKSKK